MARGDGRGRSKRAVLRPPPSTPFSRWVVERGVPASPLCLSYFRPSSFLFLLLPRSLIHSFSLPSLTLYLPLSLFRSFSTLFSRFCPVPHSALATLLFRDLVSAAALLFFSVPTCMLAPFVKLPRVVPISPARATLYYALFRLPLRSVPTTYM